jgi:hypothetical protein
VIISRFQCSIFEKVICNLALLFHPKRALNLARGHLIWRIMAPSARSNTTSHLALDPGHGEAQARHELNLDLMLRRVSEPLQNAPTGKEAIHGMLQRAVSFGMKYSRFWDNRSAIPLTEGGLGLRGHAIKNLRQALRRQVRERFEASVSEGELPENANVESMSALCMSLLNGFLFCIEDGAREALLLDSVRIFMEGLGFHARRPLKKRSQAPVLILVRK